MLMKYIVVLINVIVYKMIMKYNKLKLINNV